MASAIAPPTTPKTTTSVDPLYTAAVAQAKAALAAETAPIKTEQAASDAQYEQRQTDATDSAAALSKLLQPIGPAVSGIYQTSAQNQELAANGFSQGMQDALKGNTDNLNAMLEKLGQNVHLDSHAQEAGDVLYGLGGYNPGVSFSKTGAAFGAAATLQAGDALLRGQENVKELKGKAIVADQGFQDKIAELAGKLPGDIQTNYQHLHTIALEDARFRETVRKDGIDAAYKQANLKLSQAKYATGIAEFNAKQTLAYAKLANAQYNADRNYGIKLANLGIAQDKMALAAVKASFAAAHGGLSQAAVVKYTTQANAMANQGLHGTTSSATSFDAMGNVVKSGSKVTGGVPYFQELGLMMKKGMPVQIALDALDSVYPPNARPTPQQLANTLGPLTPDAIKLTIQKSALGLAAATASFDSNSLLLSGPFGKVTVAPGADRPGVPTSQAIKNFVGHLAGTLHKPLTIGTGSNHNEMTADGNVSDHWTGHAADIPLSGAALTRAGQQALILAGMPAAQARRIRGGLFNFNTPEGRVQIIFNTMQGGNHFTHLHVGIK